MNSKDKQKKNAAKEIESTFSVNSAQLIAISLMPLA